MSKLYPSLSGAALLVWMAGWMWWLTDNHFQKTETQDFPASIFTISHDGFKYTSEKIFHFNYSESVPAIPEDNHLIFQSLAGHLASNASVSLTLTGCYAIDEQNLSSAPNLGLARAEAIKKVLIEKGAPPERIKVESLESNIFFQTSGKLKGGVYFSFSTHAPEPETAEASAPLTEKGHYEIFFYKNSEYKLDGANLPALDSLRDYLRSNRSKTVTITGFSEPGEEENSKYALAEMRAKAVRRYLVDTGVRRSQIEVKSKPGMAKGGQERVVTLTLE